MGGWGQGHYSADIFVGWEKGVVSCFATLLGGGRRFMFKQIAVLSLSQTNQLKNCRKEAEGQG